jgi:hypothetical protein
MTLFLHIHTYVFTTNIYRVMYRVRFLLWVCLYSGVLSWYFLSGWLSWESYSWNWWVLTANLALYTIWQIACNCCLSAWPSMLLVPERICFQTTVESNPGVLISVIPVFFAWACSYLYIHVPRPCLILDPLANKLSLHLFLGPGCENLKTFRECCENEGS